MAGFFLFVVKPDEVLARAYEPGRFRVELLFVVGAALLALVSLQVLGMILELEVFPTDWVERPRQRMVLAENVSYITQGEWITNVRWMAARGGDRIAWVPNVNSDVAIFGVGLLFGRPFVLLVSAGVMGICWCLALASDQAMREGRHEAHREGDGGWLDDNGPAVVRRALGMGLWMASALLMAQWLVHMCTGVALHLPITGVALPWISHGTTTHLLYAATVFVPLSALVVCTGDPPSPRGPTR